MASETRLSVDVTTRPTATPCIWKTWIWLSFPLECSMACNIWADFICRATNWDHFQKAFFGISLASGVSTCRTTVWRNCPAESWRETMWIWYFLNSGSFRGLCPLGSGVGCRPESWANCIPEICGGLAAVKVWAGLRRVPDVGFLEGWRVGFSKIRRYFGRCWSYDQLFELGEVESCGGMGLRKGFGGFCSHLEGSGSVRNVTVISQSFAKSLENGSAGVWMNLKGSEEMAQCLTGSGGPRSIQNVD